MYALASLGAPTLLRGRRGTMCTAKGSDVRPGVPWGSAAFAWQAWDNVHCQKVGCTPWRPLGLRRFCVAGVGQCALPRGRMYALASLGAPTLFRGRRGTMCTAKGSDVRPGVPWGSAAFAWQAWDNVQCQGVGCTPWRPLGLRRFCVAGVGTTAPTSHPPADHSTSDHPPTHGSSHRDDRAPDTDGTTILHGITLHGKTPPHTDEAIIPLTVKAAPEIHTVQLLLDTDIPMAILTKHDGDLYIHVDHS